MCISDSGRTAVRPIETLYIAGLMKDWVAELIEALKSGDSEYFREPSTITGAGTGFWEAPRGALYHSESIKDGKIEGYQIIIPTTWNLAPINESGEHGPMEQALIGNPVGDIDVYKTQDEYLALEEAVVSDFRRELEHLEDLLDREEGN